MSEKVNEEDCEDVVREQDFVVADPDKFTELLGALEEIYEHLWNMSRPHRITDPNNRPNHHSKAKGLWMNHPEVSAMAVLDQLKVQLIHEGYNVLRISNKLIVGHFEDEYCYIIKAKHPRIVNTYLVTDEALEDFLK